MTIRGWNTRYRQIRHEFGYKESEDFAAAKKLDKIIEKAFPLSKFKKIISGKTVVVIGAGPSLDGAIPEIKKLKNVIKIVADGAIQPLIKNNIKFDILVTDLDGDLASIKKIGNTNIPIVIHAHGDNEDKLEIVNKFRNKIGTTQTRKFGKLQNFGGFTDGDRCVFLAERFSPKKIILFGMDFGNEIGKYSKHIVKNRQVKLKKLAYGKKLLEWFSTKSNSELYTTSKTIIGYKKINFADLDYIVNS